MDKQQRRLFKVKILQQIATLSEEPLNGETSAGSRLRLERLQTALQRIDAVNFGECFKCEQPISLSTLQQAPETTVCDNCLQP